MGSRSSSLHAYIREKDNASRTTPAVLKVADNNKNPPIVVTHPSAEPQKTVTQNPQPPVHLQSYTFSFTSDTDYKILSNIAKLANQSKTECPERKKLLKRYASIHGNFTYRLGQYLSGRQILEQQDPSFPKDVTAISQACVFRDNTNNTPKTIDLAINAKIIEALTSQDSIKRFQTNLCTVAEIKTFTDRETIPEYMKVLL